MTVMLGFAEFERDMIIQRTSEGKSIAKTKVGYWEGRPPKYDMETLIEAAELLEYHTYRQVSELTGHQQKYAAEG